MVKMELQHRKKLDPCSNGDSNRYFIDKFFGQVFFNRRKKYFAIVSLILLERDEDNKMGYLTM